MLLARVRRFTQWLAPAQTASPVVTPPDLAALRIQRADAHNLLQQLQQDICQLEDDMRILEARYQEVLGQGRQHQATLILQQIADVEQSLTLKSNRASEIAEIAQLLQWDEIQQATDFMHAAFSPNLQQTEQRIAEQLARHSMRRNQLYDLAHMVKGSEADQARMADAAHDALRARLAQVAPTGPNPGPPPMAPPLSIPAMEQDPTWVPPARGKAGST